MAATYRIIAARSLPSSIVVMGRPTCYRCWRPTIACICADVVGVGNRTPVVIVQHPRERRHPFGTVRILRLGLRRVDVHVASSLFSERAECPPCAPPGAALLFPGPESMPLHECAPPTALVVVDGTWPTARKLVRDNAWLQELPRVRLCPTAPGRYRIRRAPRPAFQLSTVEAVVAALRILEPDTHGFDDLLAAFDRMIERQIALARDTVASCRSLSG
jgi:DTW domain-containing protein YfiP